MLQQIDIKIMNNEQNSEISASYIPFMCIKLCYRDIFFNMAYPLYIDFFLGWSRSIVWHLLLWWRISCGGARRSHRGCISGNKILQTFCVKKKWLITNDVQFKQRYLTFGLQTQVALGHLSNWPYCCFCIIIYCVNIHI